MTLVEPRPRPQAGTRDVANPRGEPAWTELWQCLRALLQGADPTDRVTNVQPLKAKVYRLHFDARAPWSSVVVKRMEPAVAQRTRLLATRWLPALGLEHACARLLGAAADERGEVVWHIHEDMGDDTLAARPAPELVEAAARQVAELHVRAARHAIIGMVQEGTEPLPQRGPRWLPARIRDVQRCASAPRLDQGHAALLAWRPSARSKTPATTRRASKCSSTSARAARPWRS